jgi:hypothetical protein
VPCAFIHNRVNPRISRHNHLTKIKALKQLFRRLILHKDPSENPELPEKSRTPPFEEILIPAEPSGNEERRYLPLMKSPEQIGPEIIFNEYENIGLELIQQSVHFLWRIQREIKNQVGQRIVLSDIES